MSRMQRISATFLAFGMILMLAGVAWLISQNEWNFPLVLGIGLTLAGLAIEFIERLRRDLSQEN